MIDDYTLNSDPLQLLDDQNNELSTNYTTQIVLEFS